MSVIAIIGAGPLGSATAHKLANRSRVAEVRLIDPEESVARGKALDIQQAGPVESFSTTLSAHASILAASGTQAIVMADSTSGAEHTGEASLALLRQLEAAGITAPLVFAGASQRQLISLASNELHIEGRRLVGSAPHALASALRAMSAVVLDASAVEISLDVFGVPPRHAVIAWHEGTISGQPITGALGAHEIAALSSRVGSLWPPGPYALASAATRVAEAVCFGSRRRYSCFVDTGRGRIAAMPVELQPGGIKRVVEPSLSSVERTALETALALDAYPHQ
jgi:malate dehydrogenase